ncbi:uncharacterized protein LOC144097734 [Amblyomma americanum]
MRILTLLAAVLFASGFITKTFKTSEGSAQNVIYVNLSHNGSAVVVGGTNTLYMLSPDDLSPTAIYKTGPENDSVLCPPYPMTCDYDYNRTTTDNYNRVLLQLGTDPVVLACGTTSQGICSIHDLLQDLNVTMQMDKELKNNYIASKHGTVAFFGTGINENVLFVASTYDGRPLEFQPHAVSARVLNNSGYFSLLSSTNAETSFVDVVNRLKMSHRILYLYGFSHNGFAYFVTLRTNVSSPDAARTWLARVCESDKSFRTYMEVPIQCTSKDGVPSLIAISASAGPSGAGGKPSSKISKILAVAFMTLVRNQTNQKNWSPGSVLCFFDMASVEDAFREAAEECNMGKTNVTLSSLYHEKQSDLACKHYEPSGDITCTSKGENIYIESLLPLTEQVKLTLAGRMVSSLTVMQQKGTVVVWAGDNQGFLHKVVLWDESADLLASLNLSKIGNTGIRPSTAIDERGEHGYFLIGDKVVYAGQSYPMGNLSLLDEESGTIPTVALVFIALLGILLLAICCFILRVLEPRRTSPPSRIHENISRQNASHNSLQGSDSAAQQPQIQPGFEIDEETKAMLEAEKLLFNRELLQLGPVIGQGHFGCVYIATLKVGGRDEDQEVAVKTLRNNSRGGELDSRSFLEEALIMKDFRHTNVLPLIGLTMDKRDGLMVITPYMKHGDLLSYIRDEQNHPTVKQLIIFGIHVAEGMKYLSDIRFVHRDLAARNCMLSEDFVVRVADFGLSRDIYEKDYYSSDNKTKLPVKWMAPESLEKGIYSYKSDVWSYGVLLWELITRGVTPYPDVDHFEIVDFLKQGRRMQRPDFCPRELYRIMLQCWHNDPKMRPPFKKLVTEVARVIVILETREGEKRANLDVDYVSRKHLDLTKAAEPSVISYPLSVSSIADGGSIELPQFDKTSYELINS